MSATIMPTSNTGSTASCCPMASPALAAFSTPALSAACRWSPARYRPNTDCARSASSISRPAPTSSTTAAKSASMAAVMEPSPPPSKMAGRLAANCPPKTTPPGYAKATPAATDCFAGVQYFFSGRYTQNTVGIENPTPSYNAIHDFTQQDRGFGYMSAFIDPTTRISLITGTAVNNFQIPNVPGQPIGQSGTPVSTAFGFNSFNSAQLNENQTETTQFNVLSLQKSVDGFDGQLSYFSRYNRL